MKSPTLPSPWLVSLFFVTALLLAGCTSFGSGRIAGAGTSATLQNVQDDYSQALLQTAASEEALDGMAVAAGPDLKQTFGFFSTNRDKMEQIGSRLVTHADGMFFRGTYYFVESGKSLEACAFPRTARGEDQQSIDLGADFDAVSEAGGEIKRAFRAFQLDIEQIHDYLANNLTLSGVDSIDQILRKAKVDGDSLQDSLRQALAALQHAKTTLAQGAPPPSPPRPSP
jgi:hypothetical protein